MKFSAILNLLRDAPFNDCLTSLLSYKFAVLQVCCLTSLLFYKFAVLQVYCLTSLLSYFLSLLTSNKEDINQTNANRVE